VLLTAAAIYGCTSVLPLTTACCGLRCRVPCPPPPPPPLLSTYRWPEQRP